MFFKKYLPNLSNLTSHMLFLTYRLHKLIASKINNFIFYSYTYIHILYNVYDELIIIYLGM